MTLTLQMPMTDIVDATAMMITRGITGSTSDMTRTMTTMMASQHALWRSH